jgi:hypothetical protein
MAQTIKKLNRFTSLPVLLDLLQRKKLTFLNPNLWEDKNDTEVILEYKRRKKIKNLFALCFTDNDETVHHWKTFSNGPSGCIIEFDYKLLMGALKNTPKVKHGKVEYLKIIDIENNVIPVDKMPFTKRWPYRCEEEYRIIIETNQNVDFFEVDIPLEVIKKITISQQMPSQIYNTIKNHLREAQGNPESKIVKSSLYENKTWIDRFRQM